jgi:hypothetical protein
MTYFSEDQFPRSINRQRSEQNGKSGVPALIGFLQIGHFMRWRECGTRRLAGEEEPVLRR